MVDLAPVWNRLVVEGTFGHMIRLLDKQMMKDLDGIMILIQKKMPIWFLVKPFFRNATAGENHVRHRSEM